MASKTHDDSMREQTDKSLTVERQKTDTQLEEWRARSGEDTDDAVRVARMRADRILAAARLAEDEQGARRGGISDEGRGDTRDRRDREDTVRREEQGGEDKLRELDRVVRDEIIKELLRAEREQTDADLHSERARSLLHERLAALERRGLRVVAAIHQCPLNIDVGRTVLRPVAVIAVRTKQATRSRRNRG
jgi:hypothetical protein